MDLGELERLESQATPGPWHSEEAGGFHKGEIFNVREDGTGSDVVATTYCGSFDGHGANNARFIAAIRNATPDLFREVRTLRADLAATRAEVERLHNGQLSSQRVIGVLLLRNAGAFARVTRAEMESIAPGMELRCTEERDAIVLECALTATDATGREQ